VAVMMLAGVDEGTKQQSPYLHFAKTVHRHQRRYSSDL